MNKKFQLHKMKNKIIALVLLINGLSFAQEKLPNLKGPYLGQAPPKNVPVMFAPDFFIKEVHSSPVFAPNGKEIFWDLMGEEASTLFIQQLGNGKWSKPKSVSYASQFGAYDPCFSFDGKKLFFTSSEAPTGERKDTKENIWFVERTEKGWSDRKPLPPEVNSHGLHWQISIAKNGNLYFGTNKDILLAKSINNAYSIVENVGKSINSEFYEGTPFIAPDESYIIFSRFGGDLKYADLFISYKNKDSYWTNAKNMGKKINTDLHELCPQVTPDGKYLFFIRNDSRGELRPFWVNTKIIVDLKPNNLK